MSESGGERAGGDEKRYGVLALLWPLPFLFFWELGKLQLEAIWMWVGKCCGGMLLGWRYLGLVRMSLINSFVVDWASRVLTIVNPVVAVGEPILQRLDC